MASSSFPRPSPNPQQKYDVFISFRGQDTRNSFTSHLYAGLRREKIETFVDDQLERGEAITQLFKKIEESKISVIVLSKDYASSPWCLDELVHILECNRTNEQIVIPIFYHIARTDVRDQMGCFAEAFAKHAEDFKDRPDKVKAWTAALTEVANLAGWPSQGPESILVQEIVKDILGQLNYRSSSVGIEERISWITSLLFHRWMATPLTDICSQILFFFFFEWFKHFIAASMGTLLLLTRSNFSRQSN